MSVPLKLIALSCEYLSSQEILYIIDDYELSSQENKYMINKKFINRERYTQILEKGIFEFPTSITFTPGIINLGDITLLAANFDSINWNYYLSGNSSATKLLNDKIDWMMLSLHPGAIKLLEENKDKIYWRELSRNPGALKLLEANEEKIDWQYLSENPSALRLLEENLDKIDWNYLSKNPAALRLLEKYPRKINWYSLLKNSAATYLLEENQGSK